MPSTPSVPGCAVTGDTQIPSVQKLNIQKNRSEVPSADQIDGNAALENVLKPGDDTTRWSSVKGAVFEGYVISVKNGGIESVNCHAKDSDHRDTHIDIALTASAPENAHVIVEVTPIWRAKMKAQGEDWSEPTLLKKLVGHKVRITGWMMFDAEHKNMSENTNPGGKHNWRATAWEIHPITGIEVLQP